MKFKNNTKLLDFSIVIIFILSLILIVFSLQTKNNQLFTFSLYSLCVASIIKWIDILFCSSDVNSKSQAAPSKTPVLDLIKKGWTQKEYARNSDGNPVRSKDPNAVSWCALGALLASYLDDTELLKKKSRFV